MGKFKHNYVSVKAMERIENDTYSPTVSTVWHDSADLRITKTLDLKNVVEFVEAVVEACFNDDGDYIPQAKEFAFKCEVLERYANFNLSDMLQKKYDLVYHTDAYDTVMGYVNKTQIQEIRDAIDDKVRYMCEANAVGIQKKLDIAVGQLGEVVKLISEMFSGVTPDDIRKMATAITDGGIDNEKLMKAYFEQKKKSDGEQNE